MFEDPMQTYFAIKLLGQLVGSLVVAGVLLAVGMAWLLDALKASTRKREGND